MDLSMPGMGGLESIKRIVGKYPQAKILVFTMHDNPLFAEHALNAGAKGYITKSSAPNELVNAVKAVAGGGNYLDGNIDSLVVSEKLLRQTNSFSQLSNREFQILCLCAEGDDVAKIANRLSLSSKTVANYLTHIKEKLKVTSTAKLVRLAFQHMIVNI
jgi:DNA-binding NarL/FixJ family response regulator